jgi:hypothetical protein
MHKGHCRSVFDPTLATIFETSPTRHSNHFPRIALERWPSDPPRRLDAVVPAEEILFAESSGNIDR